jgi:hypothetical protein
MPLPILHEREWDEGLYDGWHYDAKAVARKPTVKKPTGNRVQPVGDQRPDPGVSRIQ